METFRCWSSLHGYVLFMFLTAISNGSACEVPSSPQCFRRTADESVYTCEWSLNTNESDVTFDLYIDGAKFGNFKRNWTKILEEELIQTRPVDIWLEAHVGNSFCASPKRSVVLEDTVKYETPQNISVSWMKNNLILRWRAVKTHPAQAEVWFRQYKHPTDPWEKRITNTTNEALNYRTVVGNLLKHSAYEVQIRHQSTEAQNPLWSDWSAVVIAPAELEHEPKVTMKIRPVNGTRIVTLTWPPTPHAAAVGGVTYTLSDTQTSQGCPCERKKHPIDRNKSTIYVSYSAVNISVFAKNAAGSSPQANIQVPTKPVADLQICDKTLVNEKLKRGTCLEWYELQDSRPTNVITLSGRTAKKERAKIKTNIKDYIRYLYFEHRCDDGKPQTVKMCLFYQKEGEPVKEPQDFIAFSEAQSSANLSWKAIPYNSQRGFLTHYSLCRVKISSQDEPEVCYNISASAVKHRLENLTPGSKYNISLAGVTRMGEGPKSTVTINTWPEKHLNVWLSFGLLFVFFLLTILCTVILKRIKNRIFPPVPTPVIPDFTPYQPECQGMLESKEEVHDLMLYQVHSERKSVSEEAEEATVLGGDWEDGTDEDVENETSGSGGSGDERLSPGSTDQALKTDLDQVDTELAMLIYKTGLVFDMKTDLL
ncbi:leukemia inhibitory factor receptor [Stegastes partitus]|uniref:Leukemia inhibitory factor receptor-like n=1 Tax=Stegastes partitus TaxID=144197 RepID=A0A3B4ZAN1_9TELE|nr:PREDICTED: leukemia inhibitory factor receptor-like [Stegastes partitus]